MSSVLFWEPLSWILKMFKRGHLTAVPASASDRIYHSWGWTFQKWINFVLSPSLHADVLLLSDLLSWNFLLQEGRTWLPILPPFSSLSVKRCKPIPWALTFWGQQKQYDPLLLSCQTTHSAKLCLQCAYASWEILLQEINFCKWNHPVADGNDMFKTASHTHW